MSVGCLAISVEQTLVPMLLLMQAEGSKVCGLKSTKKTRSLYANKSFQDQTRKQRTHRKASMKDIILGTSKN